MRKILFLFLAVFSASVLAKQAPVAETAKTQQLDANLSASNLTALTAKDKNAQKLNLTQDPAIISGELANGLKYYVKENKQPANSAYFYLVVNIGSTDERENELGLAHFTEHMAFNGSREFSKNELVKKFESVKSLLDKELLRVSKENGGANLSSILDDEVKSSLTLMRSKLEELYSKNKEYAKYVVGVKEFFDSLLKNMFKSESGSYDKEGLTPESLFKTRV